jgi:hypothetical protein
MVELQIPCVHYDVTYDPKEKMLRIWVDEKDREVDRATAMKIFNVTSPQSINLYERQGLPFRWQGNRKFYKISEIEIFKARRNSNRRK